MEKNFVCPVCGATCENLAALKRCILEHEIAEENAKQNEKEKKIKELKDKNENLVKKIQANCKQLKELGINTSIKYDILPKQMTTFRSENRIPISENKFKNLSNEDKKNLETIEDFFNCLFRGIK